MRIKTPLKIIESPRDGWQSLQRIIPAETKAAYINQLLKIGFDVVEAGSFVSPSAIPQLSDTSEVLKKISRESDNSKIMVLVANEKYATEAVMHENADILSFPFSISDTFLLKNLRTTYREALHSIEAINAKCAASGKEFVVYIAMAFGNPYGDSWGIDILSEATEDLIEIGIQKITLTDVVGNSDTATIEKVYDHLYYEYRQIEFGFHLHAGSDWREKIEAAFNNRCRVFDSVLGGAGGCPMTGHDLLENVDTLKLLDYFQTRGEELTGIHFSELTAAEKMAATIFHSKFC
jgi:hydroxymethylglutaryl-CoA lyase